jgi:hypothetical protein
MAIESEIESLFIAKGYQWMIGGKRVFPTTEDIRSTIDRAVDELYDEPDGTQIEVGRLIIKKRDGHFDLFVMIGEAHD